MARSREALVAAVREAAREVGPGLSIHRFCRVARVSDREVYANFTGGWPELREAAGLEPTPAARKRFGDHELLWEYHRLAERLRRLPTWNECGRLLPFSAETLQKRFGGRDGLLTRYAAFRPNAGPPPVPEPSPERRKAERLRSEAERLGFEPIDPPEPFDLPFGSVLSPRRPDRSGGGA